MIKLGRYLGMHTVNGDTRPLYGSTCGSFVNAFTKLDGVVTNNGSTRPLYVRADCRGGLEEGVTTIGQYMGMAENDGSTRPLYGVYCCGPAPTPCGDLSVCQVFPQPGILPPPLEAYGSATFEDVPSLIDWTTNLVFYDFSELNQKAYFLNLNTAFQNMSTIPTQFPRKVSNLLPPSFGDEILRPVGDAWFIARETDLGFDVVTFTMTIQCTRPLPYSSPIQLNHPNAPIFTPGVSLVFNTGSFPLFSYYRISFTATMYRRCLGVGGSSAPTWFMGFPGVPVLTGVGYLASPQKCRTVMFPEGESTTTYIDIADMVINWQNYFPNSYPDTLYTNNVNGGGKCDVILPP